MITIKEYYKLHNEDFNSETAKEFKLDIVNSKFKNIIVFYEMLNKSVDLYKYMKSFNTNDAKDIMNKRENDIYMGVIFIEMNNLHIVMNFIENYFFYSHSKRFIINC